MTYYRHYRIKTVDTATGSGMRIDGTVHSNATGSPWVNDNDATVWEDLRFPANAVRSNPATSKPDYDFTNVGFVFDDNNTETVVGVAQMPHDWALGTAIYPHIHWRKPTEATGSVCWQLSYELVCTGGAFNGFVENDMVTVSPGPTTASLLTSLGSIDMTSGGLSCIVSWKVSRVGNNLADTYAYDVLLKEFDIHYIKDSFGSKEELVK